MFKLYNRQILALAHGHEAQLKQEDKLLAEALTDYKAVQAFRASPEASQNKFRPYQVVKGVALYSISGILRSTGSFFSRYFFGLPDYEMIADAFSAMYLDEDVDRVLVDFSSPGGAVAGISDMVAVWKKLNSAKPIDVHVSGILGSAAVWLASNSNSIVASPTAEIGCVGVKASFANYSKMLEEDGIEQIDVISEGSEKKDHGAQTSKPMSEEDYKALQKTVNSLSKIFKSDLMSGRSELDEDALSGETFVAAEAKKLGLVDKVATYTDFYEEIVGATHDDGKSKPRGKTMKKKVTAEMAEAIIACGGSKENLEIISQADYDALDPSEKFVAEAQNPEQKEGEDTDIDALNTTIQELQAKLDEANTKLASMPSAETVADMREIVEAGMAQHRVALNMPAVDYSALGADVLVKDFKSVDASFKAAFKSGSLVGTKDKSFEQEEESPKVELTAIQLAMLNGSFTK